MCKDRLALFTIYHSLEVDMQRAYFQKKKIFCPFDPTQGLRMFVCLFDLILYVPSTIFQLNRERSSWVEPVQSWDKCGLLKDHNTVTPVKGVEDVYKDRICACMVLYAPFPLI